jgi:hypothetical protein
MNASWWGHLMFSTALACEGWGVERCWVFLWVGLTHCWALRHQVQMVPDGMVMAGWFLGVCHVDSGREHQPALRDLIDVT